MEKTGFLAIFPNFFEAFLRLRFCNFELVHIVLAE